jgi:hypothetical protein
VSDTTPTPRPHGCLWEIGAFLLLFVVAIVIIGAVLVTVARLFGFI